MTIDIIVINGGSSSGKTSLARSLQELLPHVWLRWSIDDLVAALPASGVNPEDTIAFSPEGGVALGSGFRRAEMAWVAGIKAMVEAGAHVILDDVFLGGAASQERLRAGLSGLRVLWVGVHCEPGVAAAREARRGDRAVGMAESQARMAHQGVVYDLEVDTTNRSPVESAQLVLDVVNVS